MTNSDALKQMQEHQRKVRKVYPHAELSLEYRWGYYVYENYDTTRPLVEIGYGSTPAKAWEDAFINLKSLNHDQ